MNTTFNITLILKLYLWNQITSSQSIFKLQPISKFVSDHRKKCPPKSYPAQFDNFLFSFFQFSLAKLLSSGSFLFPLPEAQAQSSGIGPSIFRPHINLQNQFSLTQEKYNNLSLTINKEDTCSWKRSYSLPFQGDNTLGKYR